MTSRMGSQTIDDLPDHEKLVPCPYNKAHKVVSSRLPRHLIKCRRSHSTQGTKTCRFNVAHVYPVEEINLHEESCPGRLLVEFASLSVSNYPDDKLAEEEVVVDETGVSEFVSSVNASIGKSVTKKSGNVSDDEDWSNDCAPTYNPAAATKDRLIRKHFQNMLPSELRKKREENKSMNREIAEKEKLIAQENSPGRSSESVYTVVGSGLNPIRNPSINWSYATENYSRKSFTSKQKK